MYVLNVVDKGLVDFVFEGLDGKYFGVCGYLLIVLCVFDVEIEFIVIYC